MNREILFKGKRLHSNEWVYGSLVSFDCEGYGECCHIYTGKWDNFSNDWENYEVEPKTMCQDTGLSDMYGKRIFEEDICELEMSDGLSKRTFVVSIETVNRRVINHPNFADGSSCVAITGVIFNWEAPDGHMYQLFPCIDGKTPDNKLMKVIGNTHDLEEN